MRKLQTDQTFGVAGEFLADIVRGLLYAIQAAGEIIQPLAARPRPEQGGDYDGRAIDRKDWLLLTRVHRYGSDGAVAHALVKAVAGRGALQNGPFDSMLALHLA